LTVAIEVAELDQVPPTVVSENCKRLVYPADIQTVVSLPEMALGDFLTMRCTVESLTTPHVFESTT
jgi:hypothetical protein